MTYVYEAAIAASNVSSALAGCNFHLCLHGALAALSLAGAYFALRERRLEEAREKVAHGAVYALLGLL